MVRLVTTIVVVEEIVRVLLVVIKGNRNSGLYLQRSQSVSASLSLARGVTFCVVKIYTSVVKIYTSVTRTTRSFDVHICRNM